MIKQQQNYHIIVPIIYIILDTCIQTLQAKTSNYIMILTESMRLALF